MRALFVLVFAAAVGAVAYVSFNAMRAPGPTVDIVRPAAVGQTGELAVTIDAPGGNLTRLDIVLEQGDWRAPLFSLPGDEHIRLDAQGSDRLLLTRPLGRQWFPDLKAGPARITVTAARPVLFGLREAQSSASRDIEVRLAPPRLSVQSQFHFINHAGSEMVVYRVTPPEAESGVRVGDREYRGFPAAGAGIESGDPGLRVAFFALLWDQDVKTPIQLFARDELGNEGAANFDFRVFPKKFRHSRIELNERFLSKVVGEIPPQSPEIRIEDPTDLLASYLVVNRELRRLNNERIAAMAAKTAPEILWRGPFKQMVNTAVEAGFADQRTYLYDGQDVDRQVHLGFDLASTVNAPVLAANRGRVVFAGWLGIYGETVVVDHGMGLQTLYSHLSSIDVQVGDMVERDQQLGRTGVTGMAAGDHLHFTTLLGGQPVTPIDWWSAQWIDDRILRKLREAGATGL
jgi:murein DD-endopeptidase MepM/ murein hydrolase activator NlpD